MVWRFSGIGSWTAARRAPSRTASVMTWCRFQARANSSIPTNEQDHRQDQGELDQRLPPLVLPELPSDSCFIVPALQRTTRAAPGGNRDAVGDGERPDGGERPVGAPASERRPVLHDLATVVEHGQECPFRPASITAIIPPMIAISTAAQRKSRGPMKAPIAISSLASPPPMHPQHQERQARTKASNDADQALDEHSRPGHHGAESAPTRCRSS